VVDYGAEVTIENAPAYEWLSNFLGPEEALEDDARMAIVTKVGPTQTTSNSNMVTAADIVFRYRLLDLFADVLGAPQPDRFSASPRIPTPHHSVSRMDNVSMINCISVLEYTQ
jgi:hypothetical protein